VAARRDVAVVGGGPAGTATALRLAAAGCSVVVLERGTYDRPRVGETLAPGVQPPLRALGVWERFAALGSLPSWGTRSVWASAVPDEHAHMTAAYGRGWHVDRCAFDRMLAGSARDAGADVRPGWPVATCAHDASGWRVRSVDGNTVNARVLVDATGRRAGPGRALGARRESFDRLVAVSGGWDGVDVTEEHYLLLESVPEGWWYTAPVPEARMVGTLLTDADICRRLGLSRASAWHERLREARLTAARVAGRGSCSRPRVDPAGSTRLLRRGDSRPWLAVGDAATTFDPLSSQGILAALETGSQAAAAVQSSLQGDQAVLARYQQSLDDHWAIYLRSLRFFYAQEWRWPDSTFWQRRFTLAG